MDTYLYGLLGLSLAANAFSAIGSLVANSKKRDEENQRTISSIYEELNRKIDNLHNDINDRICGLEDLLNRRIESEVNQINKNIDDNFGNLETLLDNLEEEVYNYRAYDIDDADKGTCCKIKKRN